MVLPRGSSSVAIVWSGDMGAFGANGIEVRGIVCGFPAAGHKKKGKSAEGRFLVAGEGKKSPPGIGDRSAPDICGQETGNSGSVGGPTAYF